MSGSLLIGGMMFLQKNQIKTLTSIICYVLAALLLLPSTLVYAGEITLEPNTHDSDSSIVIGSIFIEHEELSAGETQSIKLFFLESDTVPISAELHLQAPGDEQELSIKEKLIDDNSIEFEFAIPVDASPGVYRLSELAYRLFDDQAEILVDLIADYKQDVFFEVLDSVTDGFTEDDTIEEDITQSGLHNEESSMPPQGIPANVSNLEDVEGITSSQGIPASSISSLEDVDGAISPQADPALKVTATVASNQMTATLKGTGGALSQASSARFAVWTSPNQSDLLWYPAFKQADGSWVSTFTTANHRLAGTYTAQLFATIGGAQALQGSTTFPISSFTPVVSIQNNKGTTFDVVVSSNTPSGLGSVSITVWPTYDQSKTVVYPANRRADGTFMATVFLSNHSFTSGTYQIRVNSTARNGVAGSVVTKSETPKLAAVKVTATVASNQMTASLKGSGGLLSQASSARFAVWTKSDQSDLLWYPAYKQPDGSWISTFTTANHRLAGSYNALLYATFSGVQSIQGSTTFPISSFTPTVSIQNNRGTTFDVVVSSNTPSGLGSVNITVWPTSDQSKTVVYPANRRADGTFMATVFISNHGNQTGTYQIRVNATARNGVVGNVVNTSATPSVSAVKVTATVASNQMTASLKGSGGLLSQASSATFAVWTKSDQSDLLWYPAYRQADGSWVSTFTTANHRLAGTYTAQLFATFSGTQTLQGSTTFPISSFTPTVNIQNTKGTTFDVVVSSSTPLRMTSVNITVWPTSDQSKTLVYPANRRADGTFMATVFISNHANQTGTYQIRVNATANNGVPVKTVTTIAAPNLSAVKVTATVASNQMTASLKSSGGLLSQASSARFAVWTKSDRSDLLWYPAYKQPDGSWVSTFTTANHRLAGIYTAQVYATVGGVEGAFDATSFTIGPTKVACIGDSITYGFQLGDNSPNSYPGQLQSLLGGGYQILNYGINGMTLMRGTGRTYRDTGYFRISQEEQPGLVLIMLGTNDVNPLHWNATRFEAELEEFVMVYQRLDSVQGVYLLLPPPMASNSLNRTLTNELIPIYKRVAARAGVKVIDVNAAFQGKPGLIQDGVHPTVEGYGVIAQTVYKALVS